jgi:hypothetical protein
MRQEIRAAWEFWAKWIWLEAWEPSMTAIKRSSLVTRAGCVAFLVGLSGVFAFEGYDKTADRVKWFLWSNLGGAAVIFLVIFVYNLIVVNNYQHEGC